MPLHFVDAYPEKDCEVHVTKTGKTVWQASGKFMDEYVTVKARSEASAVRQWIDIAEFRYRSS